MLYFSLAVHVSDELVSQQTSNLLVTLLTYSSIVLANVKGKLFVYIIVYYIILYYIILYYIMFLFVYIGDNGASHGRLCFIILTCIAEVRYQFDLYPLIYIICLTFIALINNIMCIPSGVSCVTKLYSNVTLSLLLYRTNTPMLSSMI